MRELYEKHAEELVRFATFLVGPADAQDAVSSTMLKVLAGCAWVEVANVRAYLYRMVLNEVRMERRSAMRRRAREFRTAMRGDATELPDPRPEVLAAVAQLSPRQRAVVFLMYWEDLSTQAVAALLGITEGAVHRHLARARQKLRRSLHV